MSASLVGSEMCIRDSARTVQETHATGIGSVSMQPARLPRYFRFAQLTSYAWAVGCLSQHTYEQEETCEGGLQGRRELEEDRWPERETERARERK
eukprot:883020-Alexandrium_andersonii.AAC.1